MWLSRLLAHPLTRDLNINDSQTTVLRRKIIQQNTFLKQIYNEWYRELANEVPACEGEILEIGSGAGFLEQVIPTLITSDILLCPGVQTNLDGCAIPFSTGQLKAILMVDTLHHIPNVRSFFSEAARCIKTGGVLVMVEPWITPWSRWIYANLHAEPLLTETANWEFPTTGPLSGANLALPWILFERDRTKFAQEYPEWHITRNKPCMPFRYLVSGGISMRPLMPGFLFDFWKSLENLFNPWMKNLAMFSIITLKKE
jgi:SAM-dependent methyltransferase